MTNVYYTYAYLRMDGSPYYIGKGKGRRINSRNRWFNPPTDKSRIIFLKKSLTEEEAFNHEIYMIAILGRKDLGTGILHNKTNGGEGSSGSVRSDEYRNKMSKACSGRVLSESHRKRISESCSGEKSYLFGKTGSAHNRSKAVIAIQPDGTELQFVSVTETAKKLNMRQSDLSAHYLKTGNTLKRGKRKGWRFVYG